jgi:dehydrogenase/reductase SDR family protein 12
MPWPSTWLGWVQTSGWCAAARRASAARAALSTRGGGRIETARVDLAEPAEIDLFCHRVTESATRLDGLVHCAGALFKDYQTTADGTELTLAVHLLAPFRLTFLLSSLLRENQSSVIVTVSSGGMYTQRFDLTHLELAADGYRGAVAYARAKRAQVVLAHEWARRWGNEGVASYAMHPGWVATTGLARDLPSFTRLGPLLRTPAEGADTAVWLAADGPHDAHAPHSRHPDSAEVTEGIWLDRRRRHEYYLPRTYRRPATRRRDGENLWEWCVTRAQLA